MKALKILAIISLVVSGIGFFYSSSYDVDVLTGAIVLLIAINIPLAIIGLIQVKKSIK